MDQGSGSNQNLPSGSLCRSGCGFYGNAGYEGMCSKCYKDSVKRRQANPSPSMVAGRSSSQSVSTSNTSISTKVEEPAPAMIEHRRNPVDTSSLPSVETATPTVPSAMGPAAEKEAEKSEGGNEASASSSESNESLGEKDKKPKKSRCHTCKKKVGLTGFECRCGGLYCGLHRYSDKHGCTFDYKELAQSEIRKANPVVVGAKINKI